MPRCILAIALGFAAGAASPALAQRDFEGIGYLEGLADAPIRIVEFADYACGFCAQFSRETLPDLRRDWIDTGRANLRFIGFHNSFYKPGRDAARAAECAAAQGRFREMHDLIYERQRTWLSRGGARDRFAEWAVELGLDPEAYHACWETNPAKDRLERNTEVARDLGVRATPTFFIGDRKIEGALSYDDMRRYLEALPDSVREEPPG